MPEKKHTAAQLSVYLHGNSSQLCLDLLQGWGRVTGTRQYAIGDEFSSGVSKMSLYDREQNYDTHRSCFNNAPPVKPSIFCNNYLYNDLAMTYIFMEVNKFDFRKVKFYSIPLRCLSNH